MFVSIVIPTFDNYEDLGECLQSIKTYTKGYPYEIIIMDNGSQPLGFTDPTIRGMAAAKGDLIITLNDDCIVTKGWLDPLVKAAQNGGWVFSSDHPGEQDMKAAAWALCFTREAYETIGGFDPQFMIWCSDIDMFKRCEQAGHPVFKVAGSLVNHKYSQTTSHPDYQQIILNWQQEDLRRYTAKWGTDPNVDKVIAR